MPDVVKEMHVTTYHVLWELAHEIKEKNKYIKVQRKSLRDTPQGKALKINK